MTISTENKKALICLTLGIGLSWLIIWIVKKEKKEESESTQPIITDESITVAYNAYKSGLDAGESKTNLDEINSQLKDEFGLYVEYKSLDNKYFVRDLSGKKVKEI